MSENSLNDGSLNDGSLIEVFGHLAPYLLHVVEESGSRVLFSFRYSRDFNLGAVEKSGDTYTLILMKESRGKMRRRVRFDGLTHDQLVETFENYTGVICR